MNIYKIWNCFINKSIIQISVEAPPIINAYISLSKFFDVIKTKNKINITKAIKIVTKL